MSDLGAVPLWAREIAPAEWRERIMRLQAPLRGAVAAIVYWDVFSVRFAVHRWHELDDILGRANSVSSDELFEGLLAVGYTEKRARGRVWPQQNRGARGRRRRRLQEALTT